jgi:hypothetical protein
MIGYTTVGTNRFEEAAEFYDALLGTLGAGRAFEADTFIAWSTGECDCVEKQFSCLCRAGRWLQSSRSTSRERCPRFRRYECAKPGR